MAREVDVGTFECDCGHMSYFCEGTIREMAELSRKRRRDVRLGSSEKPEHGIVFEHGAAVGIACPRKPGTVMRFLPQAAPGEAGGARPAFTPKQGQYLAFIHLYAKLHRRAPAESDFVAFFRVSPPAVHQMIVTLERRGLIQRTPGQARSIGLMISREDLPDLNDDEAC